MSDDRRVRIIKITAVDVLIFAKKYFLCEKKKGDE